MNVVMVNPNQWECQHLSTTYMLWMWIENEIVTIIENFGHITRNYRQKRVVERGRRLKYGNRNNKQQSNLNENKNLIVLDQVLVVQTDLQYSLE